MDTVGRSVGVSVGGYVGADDINGVIDGMGEEWVLGRVLGEVATKD